MTISSEQITPSNLLPLSADADLQLYTPAEAAGFLGTTVGTLSQMRFSGTGPKVTMLNTSVRYRRRDLLAYIDSQNYDPAEGVPAHITRRKAGPGRPPGKKTRRAKKAARA
jgi:helix-turn-helix protein